MKKRKFKLLASLTSLVLVVAVMAVGVWAAIQQNLTITSNVSFTANGISGTLTAAVTGTTGAGTYGTNGSDTFSPADDLVATWEIGTIVFIPDATSGIPTDIVYTVTVENTGSSAIGVTISLPLNGENNPIALGTNTNLTAVYKTSSDTPADLAAPVQSINLDTYTDWGTTFIGVVETFSIASGETGGFAVVLHVNDYAESFSAVTINFNVNLAQVQSGT